jgi:hypothetical protein
MENKQTNPFVALSKVEEHPGDAEQLAHAFLASRDIDQLHACNRMSVVVWGWSALMPARSLNSYLHGSCFAPFTYDGHRCLDNSEIDFDQLQNYAAEFLGE